MAKSKKQRDSVVFYRSFYEAIKGLEPAQKATIYDAIFEFGLNGTEPQIDGVAKAIFTLIKPQIIANNARYFNGQKGGRPRKEDGENGSNEGENDDESDPEIEPKTNQSKTKQKPKQNLDLAKTQPKVIQSETKAKPNENEKENVNENEKENVNVKDKENGGVGAKTIGATSRGTHTRFCKPTVDEIRAYCAERSNNVDAQRFFDFYESKGWLVGRTPMKDWKACVRTWERDAVSSEQKPAETKRVLIGGKDMERRAYSQAELDGLFTLLDEDEEES